MQPGACRLRLRARRSHLDHPRAVSLDVLLSRFERPVQFESDGLGEQAGRVPLPLALVERRCWPFVLLAARDPLRERLRVMLGRLPYSFLGFL